MRYIPQVADEIRATLAVYPRIRHGIIPAADCARVLQMEGAAAIRETREFDHSRVVPVSEGVDDLRPVWARSDGLHQQATRCTRLPIGRSPIHFLERVSAIRASVRAGGS